MGLKRARGAEVQGEAHAKITPPRPDPFYLAWPGTDQVT